MAGHGVVVDVELTSRCNARCSFCPRDQTPHQGLIDDATFTAALARAVEYRDAVLEVQARRPGYLDTPDGTIWLSFCGMGEPLLHPRATDYVRRVAEAGLRPIVNTNGALLSPGLAEDLLDAGLAMACINVGEVGLDYEEVYGLPFERTRTNVERFLATAGDRCVTTIVLVDHRADAEHTSTVREYWSRRGATMFVPFSLVNRGGALAVASQDEARDRFRPEAGRILRERDGPTGCSVPFLYPFVGYDGRYYLCSSDWRKEVDLGNVFDDSIVDLFGPKADQVGGRSPICGSCTHEPTNNLALALAGDAAVDEVLDRMAHVARTAAVLRTHAPRGPESPTPTTRRLIPVRSC